jgi:D-alanine-D-alanine ligase
MKNKKIKVAVIYNEAHPELYKVPESKEKKGEFTQYFEIENQTPMEEYEYIAKSLKRTGLETYTLNIKDDILTLVDHIRDKKPDVIFNFIEIFKDREKLEMNIVGLYELMGVPYTGAPALCLANCQNKVLAKRLLKVNKIKTPDFAYFYSKSKNYKHNLQFPIIVKPSFQDASVGIENESIVHNQRQFNKRVNYVLDNFNPPVLVEEFIEGRELNVAVMGDKKLKVLPISEIDFTKMPDHLHNIVSYQAKWDPYHEAYHKTIPKCPARLPKKVEAKAKQIALEAFRVMDCRDYARVDIRLAKNKELYVLEVNPNPDLTEGAGFMRSAEHSGLSYARALKKIALLAYERGNKK